MLALNIAANYNLYKIGQSENIDVRLRIIKQKHFDVSLVLLFPFNIEVRLHRKFQSNKLRFKNEREWFKLTNEDISWLNQLSTLQKEDVIQKLK
jgi:hypothetical protein